MDSYVIQAVAIASAIAGLLAPLLTALINRPTSTSRQKQLVALAVSVLLAILGLLLAGAFTAPVLDPAAIGLAVLAVVGASQTIYALILKTSGVADKLEAIAAPTDSAESPRH